ncbi:UDP-N-acetylmuramate--L-alanine ligase [Elusimicrobiota bacterium]
MKKQIAHLNGDLAHAKRVHMVGIGGCGMSGLALVMKRLGFSITGSDIACNASVKKLRKSGFRISVGHKKTNLASNTDLVVYSSAIDIKKNPETREAARRSMSLMRRGTLLANIAQFKRSIGVSGTHGKSTTSSFIGFILNYLKFEPTVIVGGEIRDLGTNTVFTDNDLLVMETDESDGSFLETKPWIIVATNVDNDHVEHYGSIQNLRNAFVKHLNCAPDDGWVIACKDDAELRENILPHVYSRCLTYGIKEKADLSARSLKKHGNGYSFSLTFKGKNIGSFATGIAGMHNVYNAMAAMLAAHMAGASWVSISRVAHRFTGTRRRLEILGTHHGITFLDDYAHHPTAIKAVLDCARDFYPGKRLIAYFQPHRFTRTMAVHRQFGDAFKGSDFVWVAPIYKANEKPIPGVTSELVLRSLRRKKVPCGHAPLRPVEIMRHLEDGDLFITAGAGDVWRVAEDIIRRLDMKK